MNFTPSHYSDGLATAPSTDGAVATHTAHLDYVVGGEEPSCVALVRADGAEHLHPSTEHGEEGEGE